MKTTTMRRRRTNRRAGTGCVIIVTRPQERSLFSRWYVGRKIKPQQTVCHRCYALNWPEDVFALWRNWVLTEGPKLDSRRTCAGLAHAHRWARPPRRKTRERAFIKGCHKRGSTTPLGRSAKAATAVVRFWGCSQIRRRVREELSGSDALYWEQVVPRTGDDGVLHEIRRGRGRLGRRVHHGGVGHGRTPVSRGRRACGATTGVKGPRTVSRASRSTDGLGVPRSCLDAGRRSVWLGRGALVKALSESVVDVLKDMLHCDSNLRPSASECVMRLQAAMRPATAKVEEAPRNAGPSASDYRRGSLW